MGDWVLMIVPDTAQLVPRFTEPCWVQKRGNYGSNLWDGYGVKIGRDVVLNSSIEYFHWILVESNPRIYAYCEQPVKMLALVRGKNRGSYIDMYIIWADGSEELREIKPQEDMDDIENNPRLQNQIAVQSAWCERNGIKHVIVTDKEIFSNKLYLANWRTILTELRNFKSISLDDVIAKVLGTFESRCTCSIKEISCHMPQISLARVRVAIFRLIHSGTLVAPLDTAALNNSLSVSWNANE